MDSHNVIIVILQKDLSILLAYGSHSLLPPLLRLLSLYGRIALPYALILCAIGIAIFLIYTALRFWLIFQESSAPHTFLELTPLASTQKSSFTTTQLFTAIHGLARQRSWVDRALCIGKNYAFEIVSTKSDGIRYISRLPVDDSEIVKKHLVAYLPGIKISEIRDYLPSLQVNAMHVTELQLTNHFAYPLKKQENLEEYDPIAYITATMTKLMPQELVAFQVVVSPVDASTIAEIRRIQALFLAQKDVIGSIRGKQGGAQIFLFVLSICLRILMLPIGIVIFLLTEGREGPFLPFPGETKGPVQHNAYKDLIEGQIKQKIDQQLFVTSLRFATAVGDAGTRKRIEKGFTSALSPFTNANAQSFRIRKYLRLAVIEKFKTSLFSHRLPSLVRAPILSSSEISDIYHFPFTNTTKTEDLIKVQSKELPAPLSLKNTQNLDVVFGKNTYGNVTTDIGLTDEDRSRHVYIIGQTGSGKSTIMYHMAHDDIQKGRGVALVDPHGDLAEELVGSVPEKRINDLIYFNPFDIKYPVGINLLELTPTNDKDDLELEKELVCESVISIFRKVFSKDDNVDAHRIEYILRNTIYTAFTVPDATIFTVYDLLNDPAFQREVTAKLDDENLVHFWKNEFGRAGSYQIVKMVSGVTARVGRFLFSPTAKRILEQPHSTINFDNILASGKILLCNLAEGKLGEDTSQLLGTTVIAKIQQAAHRRARVQSSERIPFYLFIDEFQNFATAPFTKLLSGGRKFGLRITIAEQSTSQQSDRNVVHVILANTGTVICFRTASPVDEVLMLPQFEPAVTGRDIVNLPRYHFYIKLSAVDPGEPLSGETLPMVVPRDHDNFNRLIVASRTNYAITYQGPVKTVKKRVARKNQTQGEAEVYQDIGSLSV